MSRLPADFEEYVRQRANSRCEYCQIGQELQGATFHIEHIIPKTKGGTSSKENLALACPNCNLHKSDQTEAHDPISDQLVKLFDPRASDWKTHFEWIGFKAIGTSATGRATVERMKFNTTRRLRIREVEASLGLFPPT